MTCRDLSELLIDHLAGELPRGTRLAVALHLLLCGTCRIYVSSYRATIRLARSCAESEAEPEAVEGLLRSVLPAQRSTWPSD